MCSKIGVKILATGSYFPNKVMKNTDFEKFLDTSDEWITTRTGIKERRIAEPGIAASDLAIPAAKIAIEKARINPNEINVIIVATSTPDMMFPSTACYVQNGLGINHAFGFDILAACSGFLYALKVGKSMIESGDVRTVLLVGSEVFSRVVDMTDRNTCVLFGDGAGAMLLRGVENEKTNILSVYLGSELNEEILNLSYGGSKYTISEENFKERRYYLKMKGRELFKIATYKMIESLKKALEICNEKIENLSLIIPHQANIRIIEAVAERLEFPREKIYTNVDKYGNTSAASVIVALDEALNSGCIKPGELVGLTVFGGGLTWGATILKFS